MIYQVLYVPATAMASCIVGIICNLEAVCCFGGNICGAIDVSFIIINLGSV